jgi:two-component system sensor histidine kinase PilS (NtrC family)
VGPFVAPGLVPGEREVLALALIVAFASASATLLFSPPAQPRRLAWFICLLDTVLITAVIAATGGARSILTFLYVLCVTAACVLLSRTRGLAIAAVCSVLYTGIVVAHTVLPLIQFFDAPQETTALELVTMFLNAATLLVVAIVAGGLGERYRATRQELETRQKDLRDLQAFKDLVFQSVGTGLIALDREHRITAFNRAAEEIIGVAASQAVGRAWSSLIGAAVPLEPIEVAIGGNPRASTRLETMLRRPDGTTAPVRMTFSALRSGEGERLGLISACEDLSAIREMESRMRQADRLATVGRMAANIAHEIRNPLASLTGAIEVLTSPLTAEDARERLSQIVARESERLNHIIKNFLEYARPAPLSIATFDAAAAIEEVLLLLEHRASPGSLKVIREFAPSMPWPVDAQQFRQILWNLCLNAVEAMPNGGELRVAAAVRCERLEVSVSDTGDGINAVDLSHVFEPFFSTKPEGTGLGLALVHRIIQDHGGEIDVRSAPGLGTTFTLTLPPRDA